MENEPKQANFNIDNYGEILRCTPDNTVAYLYDDPEQDHIFYIKDEDDSTAFGYHIFRGSLPSFDRVIAYMTANGYSVHDDAEFTENDREALNKHKAVVLANEYQNRKLSARQKAKVKFLRYILKRELLIDEDFNGEGEMFI